MKIVIVGGVAGGASAAARLRRLDEHAQIILLEKGPHISYANCGLPYYIGDVIQAAEKLTLQTPESFYKRFRIDVRINSEAVRILRDTKQIEIKQKDGSCYWESYDKLILSPGAKPIRPKLPGIDSPRIFTLRIPDTFAQRLSANAYPETHPDCRGRLYRSGAGRKFCSCWLSGNDW